MQSAVNDVSVCVAVNVFSAFMSSLQIDDSLHIIPEPEKLPQTLVEKCAAISVRPNAIKDLIDAMQCKLTFLTRFCSIYLTEFNHDSIEFVFVQNIVQLVYAKLNLVLGFCEVTFSSVFMSVVV